MPIFDQGYQYWQGQLSGRALRWWTITRQGARAERGWWLTRLVLFGSLTPVLALMTALVLWGLFEQKSSALGGLVQVIQRMLPEDISADPTAYRAVIWTICYEFFFAIQFSFAMVLVVLVGPRLISQDLRFNAIPLYLARPLRRIDYFVGKWGVIAIFLALIVVLPAVLAWLVGICFSPTLATIRDTVPVMLAGVGYGVVFVVSAGTCMLALSALSRKSGHVMVMWFGFWIISGLVASLFMAAMPQKSWPPVLSYTQNVQRVGNAMLDTRGAWQRVQDVVMAAQQRARAMAPFLGGGRARAAEQAALERERRRRAAAGLPPRRPQIVELGGPGYPWYWSAAILAGLFLLSAGVLSSRVRTLDRLR